MIIRHNSTMNCDDESGAVTCARRCICRKRYFKQPDMPAAFIHPCTNGNECWRPRRNFIMAGSRICIRNDVGKSNEMSVVLNYSKQQNAISDKSGGSGFAPLL